MTDSFVLSSLRTPFAKFGKGYASVRPDDLAASVIASLIERHVPDVSLIDEAIFGNANGAGEENRNVARMSLLLAGLPTSIPGSTVNRLCGSGLDAAISAARMIETGDAELVIAGGVESMTRAPWVLLKPDKAFPAQNATLENTALGWRLVNPKMPQEWSVSLGLANEAVATKYKVSRVEQDEFAMRSHQLASQAWDNGFYDSITSTVAGTDIVRDESIRAATTMSDLASLKPAFAPDGSITAGNASPLSDGAAAMLIGSSNVASQLGLPAVFRIASRAAHAVDPQWFGIAPIEAANRALTKAGIAWSQVDAVELNEAFAAQSLACVREWGIDAQIVNARGGAIAIGHPLGASGIRILSTLVERMRVDNLHYGVASICIGVGQALAVVIENLAYESGVA